MNSLADFKALLERNSIKVKNSDGVSVTVGRNVYSLAHGEMYKNNELISHKELVKFLKLKKK